MTQADPVARSGTQKKTGTAEGRVPGSEVTQEELSPTRGFPAGMAIGIVALILVGTLIFALFFAGQAPDLSPEREEVIILEDGDPGNGSIVVD